MSKNTVRRSHPRRARKRRKPVPQKNSTPQNNQTDLNSINLTKIINGFYTLRSTLKDLSQSLHRMERIMDNAYQMFEMANQFMGQRRSPSRFRPPLRLVKPNRHEEEEIPRLNLPPPNPDPEGNTQSSPNPLQQFDFSQLIKILQSPLFKQILSQLMQAKTSEIPNERKQKQGQR